jgi:hypothetical protein
MGASVEKRVPQNNETIYIWSEMNKSATRQSGQAVTKDLLNEFSALAPIIEIVIDC